MYGGTGVFVGEFIGDEAAVGGFSVVEVACFTVQTAVEDGNEAVEGSLAFSVE